MRFAAPLGLAALVLAAPLALSYLLRSRRPRVEVASTLLWQATDRTVAAAIPWQRFRPDRTFWLVLAVLVAGAGALARPALPVQAAVGDHTILVLDASGSMLADEDGPTRLELARRQALDLVERVGPGRLVSVVEAGSRPRVLLSASDDAVAAARAVRTVQAGHGHAELADAFTLAASLERPGQHTVTHLFTDGVVPVDAVQFAPQGLIVDPVGQDRPNLAVTRLQASPSGAGAATAFVQVRNFGTVPAEGALSLEVVDAEGGARPVAERAIALGPREVADLVIPVPQGGGLLRARVTAAGGDALGIDDQAWAVLAGPRRTQVLVAGPENVFLVAALSSLPGVEVTAATGVPEDLTGVDLLIVDRIAAPAQARVPTIYLAPSTPPEGVTLGGTLDLPAIVFQDPEHPLMADVDLSGVAVASAQSVDAPLLRPIASAPAGPLMLAGRLGPAPVVYVAFDLMQSNLPLQVAWPVLAANAVAWLTGPPPSEPTVAGAQPLLTVPDGVTGITVTPPDGPPLTLDPSWPQLATDRVGVWTVAYEGGDETVPQPPPLAVNADPAEGDLARERPPPAEAPPAQAEPPPVQATEAAEAGAQPTTGERVFGRELLIAVLGLLVVEWAWSHRRRA